MTTTPSREDWENKIVDDETNRLYVRTEDYPDGELIMGTEIKDFIRNLLKNHNNALVAEIEKEKINSSECYCVPHEGCGCVVIDFNKALDTIIRIIQEK